MNSRSSAADSQLGPIMECGLGEIMTEFCEDSAALAFGDASPYGWFIRRVCNTSLEAFATCSGFPGNPGVHCEVCAGINNDLVEADLGLVGGALEGGLLYCFSWASDLGLESGEGHVVSFVGGVIDLGTPQSGVSLSCGGYDTLGLGAQEGSGYYCSGTAYFDFTQLGVPLKCELGVIVIDPQKLLAELKKYWDYDPVATGGPDPAYLSVGCNPSETRASLQNRCHQAAAGANSGAQSTFGYAVSCEDVWQNQCSPFFDCSDSARRECDQFVNACVRRSQPNCSDAVPHTPAELIVPCFRGDSRVDFTDRCHTAIGARASLASTRFGRSLTCEDVWQNQCSLFADCPESARADCDARVNSCVLDSEVACRREEGGRK